MEERHFRRSNQNLGTFSSLRAPAQACIEDELVIRTNPESCHRHVVLVIILRERADPLDSVLRYG
jgi:hypothetical protein